MVTIIMFLIFSKANFFLASLMIGGGVVADIFIYRFLVKPMLQKKGILASKEEAKDTDGSEEEYIKKSPLSDSDLVFLASCYNTRQESEEIVTAFFLKHLENMPELRALTEKGKEIDYILLSMICQNRVALCFDEIFGGTIPSPAEAFIKSMDAATDIAIGRAFAYFKKLNHSLHGADMVIKLLYAITYEYVGLDEEWLYDEMLFNETSETDPDGKKMLDNIRPMLEAAGYPFDDE